MFKFHSEYAFSSKEVVVTLVKHLRESMDFPENIYAQVFYDDEGLTLTLSEKIENVNDPA